MHHIRLSILAILMGQFRVEACGAQPSSTVAACRGSRRGPGAKTRPKPPMLYGGMCRSRRILRRGVLVAAGASPRLWANTRTPGAYEANAAGAALFGETAKPWYNTAITAV